MYKSAKKIFFISIAIVFIFPVMANATWTALGDTLAITPEGNGNTVTPEPNQVISEDSTKVYPMPASTQANFVYRMTEAEGDPIVRVYNTHFRLVAEITGGTTATGEGTIHWDCSGIAPGIYFYQITIGDKKSGMKKFIIAR